MKQQPISWDADGNPMHCRRYMIGVQYVWNHPEHYDGVSEWRCDVCGTRFGRWTRRELKDGEVEKKYGRE
jgi:hypothetical protein